MKKKESRHAIAYRDFFFVLSKADSNHHKQNQNLLCYHYTIGHRFLLILQVKTIITGAKVVVFYATTKYFRTFLTI